MIFISMRKTDKKKNIERANLLLEARRLQEIHPNWEPDPAYKPTNKWDSIEKEVSEAIIPIIDRHAKDFGGDSYAVIDAIQQVFDNMFEKVRR